MLRHKALPFPTILTHSKTFFCEWCKFCYCVMYGNNAKYFTPQNPLDSSESFIRPEALRSRNFPTCRQQRYPQEKWPLQKNSVPQKPPNKALKYMSPHAFGVTLQLLAEIPATFAQVSIFGVVVIFYINWHTKTK